MNCELKVIGNATFVQVKQPKGCKYRTVLLKVIDVCESFDQVHTKYQPGQYDHAMSGKVIKNADSTKVYVCLNLNLQVMREVRKDRVI